ncbi:hypothetical protein Hanom_Chr15g01395311 [Helianthus anomalus]
MANLDFSELHNVCAYLDRSPTTSQFHDVFTFLERSSISFAIQERPPVFYQHVRSFWDSAELHDGDNVQGISATVSGHEIVITQAMVRDSLRLNDADGAIYYYVRRIAHFFGLLVKMLLPSRNNTRRALLGP